VGVRLHRTIIERGKGLKKPPDGDGEPKRPEGRRSLQPAKASPRLKSKETSTPQANHGKESFYNGEGERKGGKPARLKKALLRRVGTRSRLGSRKSGFT